MQSKTGIPIFEEMTSQDVAELLKKTDICIIPVGAVEQHGYHLPLGTDTFIAQEIACRACAILEGKGTYAAVGPSIPFGFHPEAAVYKGSVQIMPRTLITLLKDVCVSLKGMGFKRIVLLMGHDANIPAMHVASQELQVEEELDVMSVNWLLPHMEDQKRILVAEGIDGHGGARETSRALASFPRLVHLDKAVPFVEYPSKQNKVPYSGQPLVGGAVYRPITKKYTKDCPGQAGDPTLATADAGDLLYDALGNWLAALLEQEYNL